MNRGDRWWIDGGGLGEIGVRGGVGEGARGEDEMRMDGLDELMERVGRMMGGVREVFV